MYPQIKRKALMSQILDLFPSMSKKKLSKQGFNFKLRGKFRLRNTTKVQIHIVYFNGKDTVLNMRMFENTSCIKT